MAESSGDMNNLVESNDNRKIPFEIATSTFDGVAAIPTMVLLPPVDDERNLAAITRTLLPVLEDESKLPAWEGLSSSRHSSKWNKESDKVIVIGGDEESDKVIVVGGKLRLVKQTDLQAPGPHHRDSVTYSITHNLPQYAPKKVLPSPSQRHGKMVTLQNTIANCFGIMCIHIVACITDRDLTYH